MQGSAKYLMTIIKVTDFNKHSSLLWDGISLQEHVINHSAGQCKVFNKDSSD